MIETIILALILLLSSTANAAPKYVYQAGESAEESPVERPTLAEGSVKIDPKRLVNVVGVIDETTLIRANELLALASLNNKPIDVLISSPGGYINHGLYFIQAMAIVKAKGIVVRCHVPIFAASMAFTIFTQCSERYALPYAQLLFHSPRISGNFLLTPQSAAGMTQGLVQLERILLNMIIPVMGVTKDAGGEWFSEAYLSEKLWIATDLRRQSPLPWFTVVARIEGYPGTYPSPRGEEKE